MLFISAFFLYLFKNYAYKVNITSKGRKGPKMKKEKKKIKINIPA